MTNILNQIAEKWFSWELSMFWQVGLLILIVAGFDLLIRKWAWPQVRYALWLLVLVKLILPPTLTSPTSFTAEIPFLAKQAAIKINQPQITPLAVKTVKSIEPIPTEIAIQPVEIVPAASAAPAVPAVAPLSGKTYVLFVWLLGVVILSGWLIIRLSNLRREHLKDQSKLPERLENLLVSTARKLGLKNTPQVILTNKVCCPAVFGILRPVLLMPADKLQNFTKEDAENIFLHELAHIKRGDLFIHAVYMILQIAYWFNPLLWLIRKHLQNLRELCCDATVARLLREKTIGYRQTLLETARQLLAEPVDPGLGLLGLFENSSWLVDRLRWLEKKSWRYRPLRIATIFILICLMSACVLPMTKFEAPADFVIKGTVTDAQTGKPIAGAKVGDTEEYAEGRFSTTADSNGNYSYKTWYEEHGITAIAEGYQKERKTLLTKLFGSEKEKVINFALVPSGGVNYASVTVEEGIGFDDIIVDDGNCTIEFLKSRLGQPDEESKDEQTNGYRLNYRKKYGLDFWLDKHKVLQEIRLNQGFKGKLTSGISMTSTQDDIFKIYGRPIRQETPNDFDKSHEDGVLFFHKGWLARNNFSKITYESNGLIFWFDNDIKVKQIVVYKRFLKQNIGAGKPAGQDESKNEKSSTSEMNSKIDKFDIDNATRSDVMKIFGKPTKYIWGEQVFDQNNLPDRYIMVYPGSFRVFIMNDRIIEFRFEGPSDYVFGDGLVVGSSIEKAFSILGQPSETVEGKPNGFKDNVFYKDIDGKEGRCYYARPEKNIRIWFFNDKVCAIYLTRSNFRDSAGGGKELKEAELSKTSFIDKDGRIVDKVDYPFITDTDAIGGWESVDFVKEIEDFKPGVKNWQGDLFLKELFLLEDGKTNWAFSWTKGLILHSGEKTASKYIIKEIDGSKYMFMEWKSGDYTIRHTKPCYYVLKQNKDAVYVESTTTDKIDYPFVNDPCVLGRWQSVDFVEEIERFEAGKKRWIAGDLSLKELVFLPDGKMNVPWYTWTKGLVIHSENKTASRYVIKELQGSGYMFFEWKSGDYTIRGMKPKYYVLKKEAAGQNESGKNIEAAESQKPAGQSVYPINFEITEQAFLQGDSIKITEIFGSADKIEIGQTYTIKGKYKLSSSDKAVLNIYATNGNIESEQGPVVKRGMGDFTRTFTYSRDGWLHLSFYPTDGGRSFGSLYFAQKGSGQKIPDISQITDVISVETSKPAGQVRAVEQAGSTPRSIAAERGQVTVIQQPTKENDYELVVNFDDDQWAGPCWYNATINITTIETNPTEKLSIHVRAYIDGVSNLVFKKNSVYWHNLKWAAPGRYGGNDYPTYINGIEWIPQWSGAKAPAELRGEQKSEAFKKLPFSLPRQPVNVQIEAEKPAGQEGNRTVEQVSSGTGKAIPLDKTTDPAQIKNIMATMGGTFYAARIAIQSPGGGTDSAAKIMEEALPQFEKFESTVQGTNISDSVHLIIEQIRQAIKANKDGDSARAAALIYASENSWNELKNIVISDNLNNRSISLKPNLETNVQIGAGEQLNNETSENSQKVVRQNKIDNETNNVLENSVTKKNIKTARTLRITVYEGNDVEPDVSVNIPLIAMKIVRQLLPSKDKLQIIAQKIKLDENLPEGMDSNSLIDMLDGMLKQVDQGVEATTLLEVKDGTERVKIVLE